MEVRYLPLGETALSVEFGNDISYETNGKVSAFAAILEEHPIEGVIEAVPSYRAVALYYKPDVIRYQQLVDICKEKVSSMSNVTKVVKSDKCIEIPVVYGGDDITHVEACRDMEDICKHEGLTREEVIKRHTENLNRVYMLGFIPGMAYMSSDNGFTIPRLETPRLKVAEGTVVIWKNQTSIETVDTPDGWHIIGRTPLKVTDLKSKTPFLFEPGMWLKFVRITPKEYEEIKKQVENGTYLPKEFKKEDA